MKRRVFLLGLAALTLAACASTQPTHPPAQYPGFVSSDRIEVTQRGGGPHVILIPGLTSHRDVWETTAAALESGHTVHIVQVKGFAGFPAEANAEGAVAAPVAEEIARYIIDQRLGRASLIGHSMGGTIAMMVAARHPDLVDRVMVVDMFPWMGAMFGPPGATVESVRPIGDQIRSQMISAPPGSATPMVEQMIATMVRTESARPQMMQYARDSNRATVANAFHELIVTDLRPELPNIRAPLTVLYVIPPNAPIPAAQYEGYMRASYATVPQARLVRIDDSYHFIMVDQFERFTQEVRAFLAN
ncbi:MAG: alpha/beta fold hydrolase [Caulobacteraceae bacterium]